MELGDGLPTQVCNECVAHLNAALTFKEKCLTADSILRHLLNSAVSDALLLYFVAVAMWFLLTAELCIPARSTRQ